MALLYAKPTEYAIRALTYLALNSKDGPVSVQEIAGSEDISSHHLSKVMKNLARGKFVKPLRGPGGGYSLLKEPAGITLWEVLEGMNAHAVFEDCAIGWAKCEDSDPCPLHDRWKELRGQIQAYLQMITIADLAKAVTGNLGGKVGITPRIFLKKLVGEVLDRIDQFEDFSPREHYMLTISDTELTEVERASKSAGSVDEIELDL